MFNFALVGCGGMANWHAQQLAKIPEVKVVALCDCVAAQTKAFKEKYFADAVACESYEAMLEKPPVKLDAVVLVTPHTTHFPQAKAALERGINVLVEKPMVTSSDDAFELWRTVKRTGSCWASRINRLTRRSLDICSRNEKRGTWEKFNSFRVG